jgi:CRISPR system Cascade subunit CasE
MTQMWLIRARLRRDAQVAALAPLLMPQDSNDRTLAGHRLIWSLMPEDTEADRDFLWREEAPGRFLVLAARMPNAGSLFDVEAQPFVLNLAAGDRLRFVQRGVRADVVMRALHAVAQDDRAACRPALIREAGAAWLAQQGSRHGFTPELETLDVDGYRRLRIARTGAGPIQVATLDYAGVLRVDDPSTFLSGLFAGFGRAKAFGCGLMLIRRA